MTEDGNWLAGLTDGEGCFVLVVTRRGPAQQYRRVEFEFKISLRCDDFRALVEARRLLGCGRLMIGGKFGKVGVPRFPLATLFVNRKADVRKVIDFFNEWPLRSKKRADFEVWKAAFEDFTGAVASAGDCLESNRRFTRKSLRRIPEDLFDRMLLAADRLKAVRAYDPTYESLTKAELGNGPTTADMTVAKLALVRLCACGCGQRIVATRSAQASRPRIYIRGHHRRKKRSA
jgi:hypothetical protein